MEIQQKIVELNSLFNAHFLDAQVLFMYCFNSIPSSSFVEQIDGEKAFKAVKDKYAGNIRSIHSSRTFRKRKGVIDFDDTVLVLENECVLTFDTGYCEILHNYSADGFVKELVEFVKKFRVRERRAPLEINLIVQGYRSFELRSMEIKRTKLDLGLFYEDDFAGTDELIRKRLSRKNDKGIVLLHGLPGTGKTTYLRYLIGKLKKRIMFLSPTVAGNLMNPEFIELLIRNPDTILIIEDAENIIMDRRHNSSSSVSNLLNISDGLLADFLNVQLICTFNSPVAMVDSALLRKGRLIAKYEFGKLGVEKARRLAAKMGLDQEINQPMTIAEITNPHEKGQQDQRTEVMGFRLGEVMMN